MGFTNLLPAASRPPSAQRESYDIAAERLGIDAADLKALVESTGMRREEIRYVEVTDQGVVVVTHDGVEMIGAPVGTPDGAGHHGWLLVRRPDGRPADDPEAPALAVPVFTPRSVTVAEDTPDPTTGPDYSEYSHKELVEVIDARNEGRPLDEQLAAKGSKADLVATLVADDAARAAALAGQPEA